MVALLTLIAARRAQLLLSRPELGAPRVLPGRGLSSDQAPPVPISDQASWKHGDKRAALYHIPSWVQAALPHPLIAPAARAAAGN